MLFNPPRCAASEHSEEKPRRAAARLPATLTVKVR